MALRACLALLVLALATAPVSLARAADPLAISVVLTGVTASDTDAAGVVTVSGTVTNASTQPAYRVQAQLWRSTATLRSPQSVGDAVAGTPPPGRTVATEGATADLSATPLAPGETRQFMVRASLADMALTTADATYWVGVNVRSATSVNGGLTTAEARTLLTLPGPTPTGIVTVIELSSRPRQVKPLLFADDTLATELAGRLRVLLDAAARPGASWVADPALIAEVTVMAGGYRVVDGNGNVEGTGSAVAQQWLADFEALTSDGHFSLFGRPDLTSALGSGGEALTARLLKASLPTERGIITLAAVDSATLAAVKASGLPVLALDTGLPTAWARAGDTPLVSAVSPSAPLLAPSIADTPLNRSLVLAARARASGAQVRLVRTEDDLAADLTASQPGGVRRTLADLLGDAPAAWSNPLTVAGDAPQVMRPGDVERLATLADAMQVYAAAAPASGVGDLIDAHLARAASGSWAGDPAGRESWLATLDARIGATALNRGLTLTALPRVLMSAAENEFPVTLTNALPDDVVLRVAASTDTPQRIRVEPSGEITVRAGTSTGGVLKAVASGNGVATALLHAETTDGRRLTSDVSVVVEATNLGALAWAIVAVSGAVLVVSTVLRIRQVRRRNRGGDRVR